ncbi:uncharacterized protein TM35_000082790 [Trypanosoma theileri]|uniref:Uncharacterized protein n=1 Tax=Trypanosoma theileri TaxID=67003 RepID=A0A1X0P0X0_9TRYP|nr:uncharacterized protein TM35_000082790 [Trypanosoma theileri]ORC90481.1 hypothetical protein TM35_000082790 [Trypanosoma theileri]
MIPQTIRRWGPSGESVLSPPARGGRGRAQPGGTGLPALPKARTTTVGSRPPARQGVAPSRVDLMIIAQDEEDVMEEEEQEMTNHTDHRDGDDADVESNSLDSLSSSSSTYMRHHRYEDPYTAYQLISDPYDRHREIERQQRFISDCKRLGRPFIPSGGRALERPTRYLLGDCVAALYRTVARDWAETDPMVISTAEDLVVVYMKRNRVRNTGTLLRYMNASLKRSEAVRTFGLQKVPEGWDVLTDDGYIMYTFKPPWVRQRRFLPDQIVVRKAH